MLGGDDGRKAFGFIRKDDSKDAFVLWRIIGKNDSFLVKNGRSLKKKANGCQNDDVKNNCSDHPDHAAPQFSLFYRGPKRRNSHR